MNKVYLLLGSNLGNSYEKILQAKENIQKTIGNIARESSLYQTAAWGNKNQPDFLNQVIVVETKLDAFELLKANLCIEEKMGRMRTIKNAPRTIDIDILFFNKKTIYAKELVIPHSQIQNRRFVLIPLNELSPNFTHPVLKKTVHKLMLDCKDNLNVKKF